MDMQIYPRQCEGYSIPMDEIIDNSFAEKAVRTPSVKAPE